MKNVKTISVDVDERVKNAVNNSMNIYMNKLASGFYEAGLENTFQMYLSNIISNELENYTLYYDERFVVKLEKNIPINGMKDYIDIVIEYWRGDQFKQYLIELKFKKYDQGAPDNGQIDSYIDICNLDWHRHNTQNVSGCFFIFLTDWETYLKESKTGTRTEVPMYDGYEIIAGKQYTLTGDSAVKYAGKFGDVFVVSQNYSLEYEMIECQNNKKYWFYIIEM